jgi:WD40 repeat protein
VDPTGQLVALLQGPGVQVVEVATGDRLFTVPAGDALGVWDMAWSPDGGHLAIAWARDDHTRALVVVDRTGASVGRFPEIRGYHTRSVSFSADGRSLATTRWGISTIDPTRLPVRIWDLESREVVREIDATAELTEFAPTGGLIASSRPVEGIAEVWEAETGDLLATMTATAHVRTLSFDAAGAQLATAHADGTVRLWDPRTGAQELVLEVGTQVDTVRFSSDGSKLVTQDEHGSVRVWALDLEDLIRLAHDELTRELSEDECRQYLRVARCSDA